MKLILSQEQEFLKETAASFAKEKAPISHLRALRDSNDDRCWDESIWQEMVQLGWSGILIPEEYGGSNFGLAGISTVMQELGKTLCPSPLFATAILGSSVINVLGNNEQKDKFLTQIADGSITMALAIDEGSHHNPLNISLEAQKKDKTWLLNGSKVFVIDGASADFLILIARTSGAPGDSIGLTAFIVESNKKGITINQVPTADSRNYANIEINNLKLSDESVLGEIDSVFDSIEKILDLGRIAIAAEMLGNAEEAFEITLNYLKERKQFGVHIGSFQALQHRAAKMFCEIELTKSAVIAAMHAADENSNQQERLASLAKFQAGETLHQVSNEAIQMHGGIGVTDEYDIGFYLKRARVAEQIFGSSNFHKNRYATISGY
tara:strand:- start:15197 stop:16336 length:1140 start_codon:yes stop_codon:yes gene_type:complete